MFRSGAAPRAAGLLITALSLTAASIIANGQMATADRVKDPGWWPTKGTAARSEYAGSAACRDCHPAQSATQPSTSMARTAARAEDSLVLRGSPRLTLEKNGYAYAIVSSPEGPLYRVAKDQQSVSAPLTWAFGDGKVGQSYLFERNGALYEARVSYYQSTDGLGFTPGRALASARSIDDAMARRIDDAELRRCFACHTTASVVSGRLDLSKAVPGVTCEACHGPGRRHAEVMQQPRHVSGDAPMLNPATLRAEESVDFCGACHATFFDVVLAGETGIAARRSQPYRLRSSRCWTQPDARLTCTACHDPHRPLDRSAEAYDSRCLACHVSAGAHPSREHPGRACPIGTAKCVGCHMAKFEVPEMKRAFTDHRIARP